MIKYKYQGYNNITFYFSKVVPMCPRKSQQCTGKVETNYKTHPINAGHFRRHGRKVPLDSDLKQIDMIIRNTYNVLMKRGMKGCYIYCMNKELSNYLKTIF